MEQRDGVGSKAVSDLLVILGVLLVDTAAGFWFSEQRNNARYEEVQNQLAKVAREDDGEALRTYYEQMTQLLLEKDLRDSADDGALQNLKEGLGGGSEEESEEEKLARAHTITAIADSDAEANRSLTRFLVEMDLVTGTDPVRLLSGSYLPGAELSGTFLPAAALYQSGLEDADLSEAFLISADLRASRLNNADLSGAKLRYANLAHTDLVGADLRNADLSQASLEGADLRGANLEGATIIEEQLDTSESLEGATMPDGSKYR